MSPDVSKTSELDVRVTDLGVDHPAMPVLRIWLLTALAAGLLYTATMAPGIAWADSGNAQLRVAVGHLYDRQDLVRSHVPFYLVVGWLVEVGVQPALAANLVAAVSGALTVANMAWLLCLLVRRRAAVISAVVLLLFSHALWHQATVAEVMTFSTMLLSLELVMMVKFVRSRRRAWLVAALLLNGMGLATHNMSVLMWPAYIVVIALVFKSMPGRRAGTLAAGVGALLAGASPLVALFIHAWRESGDVGYVVGEMLVGRYSRHVFNTSISLDTITRAVAYTCYSFPSPLLLASAIGIWTLCRRPGRPLNCFLIVGFLGYLGFAIRYTVPDQHGFMVHSYLFGIIFVAMGVDRLCARYRSPGVAISLVVLASLSPAVYAVVPDLLRRHYPDFDAVPRRHVLHRDRFDWFLKPWRHGYQGPEQFAREVFDDLPADAVLVVDPTLRPPLLYLQCTEGLRRDVQIVGAGAFQRWFDAPFDLGSLGGSDAVRNGRVFTVTDDRVYLGDQLQGTAYGFIPRGVVYQLVFRGRQGR